MLFAQHALALRIVGSSTVFPFSATVMEKVNRYSDYDINRVIESIGTGGGFKTACSRNKFDTHIINASRRITLSEFKACSEQNIQLVEFLFGYDGIVLIQSRGQEPLRLSQELLFVALADDNGFGKKPKTWAEAGELLGDSDDLPNWPIKVYGPPPTSGTRDAFAQLFMEEGAKKLSSKLGWAWDKETIKEKSHFMREDDVFLEIGENDQLIVRKLTNDPQAVGIAGFYNLDLNRDKVQGISISGVEPTFESIESKSYPGARELFFYVRKDYPDPISNMSIMEYITEFISQKAIGEWGYLFDHGLIPLTEEEFNNQFEKLESLPVLTEEDLL